MTGLSYLTAEIAGQLVAMNVDAVQAVLPMDEIVSVPLTPSAVVGITTKRGHVLTVIDARAAIADGMLPDTNQSVVVHINGHRYALLVDAIHEVISVGDDEILPPPPAMQGSWANLATGMIRIGADQRALVVRLEHFVEMSELQMPVLNHTLTNGAVETAPVS